MKGEEVLIATVCTSLFVSFKDPETENNLTNFVTDFLYCYLIQNYYYYHHHHNCYYYYCCYNYYYHQYLVIKSYLAVSGRGGR
jgi:hypothetical protein